MSRRMQVAAGERFVSTDQWVGCDYWTVRRRFAEEMVLPPKGRTLAILEHSQDGMPGGFEAPFGNEKWPGDFKRAKAESDELKYIGGTDSIHVFWLYAPRHKKRGVEPKRRLVVNQRWHYKLMAFCDEVRVSQFRVAYLRDGEVAALLMCISEWKPA